MGGKGRKYKTEWLKTNLREREILRQQGKHKKLKAGKNMRERYRNYEINGKMIKVYGKGG